MGSGASVKEQSYYDLVSEHEAQRACVKVYVHRDRKGSKPAIILHYSLRTKCSSSSSNVSHVFAILLPTNTQLYVEQYTDFSILKYF